MDAGAEMTRDQEIDYLAEPEVLEALQRAADLQGSPQVVVLDTSCVRTGLLGQLKFGTPPRSIRAARSGSLRLFMEYQTLLETARLLQRFSQQLGVSRAELVDLLNADWLPHISVVYLPETLLHLDERAASVEILDSDDLPAAALSAMLSPAILLTHNTNDFAPLGVRQWHQGTDAVMAASAVNKGELELQGMMMLPAAPMVAAGATAKVVVDRVGPAGWLLLPLLGLSGYYLYRLQSPDRQQRLKQTAKVLVKTYMEMASKSTEELNQARHLLAASVVPGPSIRTPISAVMRVLARTSESLSAQQICDRLQEDVRPSVKSLRDYMHANKEEPGLFCEVRSGGFQLGRKGWQIR